MACPQNYSSAQNANFADFLGGRGPGIISVRPTLFWPKAPPGREKNIPKGTASNG